MVNGVTKLPTVRFHESAEKNHAPLSVIASAMLGRTAGDGTIIICDAASPAPSRRSNDVLVLLRRGPDQGVERVGVNCVRLTYVDPTDQAPLAALIAAVAQAGAPVYADTSTTATMMLAERVGKSDIPVLIEGPTGTGKEVMAHFIHNASARRDGPFVAINCAAMPEAMLETLLFGHRKGAFTGATEHAEGLFRAADGGTLLLDEIAEMPLGLQAKLLRALQEGEVMPVGATKPIPVDVRVIACANRNLPQEVAEGRFRADLYYRLNVFPLHLTALRERADDVAPLAFAMMLRHGEGDKSPAWIDAAALAKLRLHVWPGNVRELENVMRRALLFAGNEPTIRAEHVVFDDAVRVMPRTEAPAEVGCASPAVPIRSGGSEERLSSIVRKLEAQAIVDALEEFNGNRLATARKLGISERTLRYRLANMRDNGLMTAEAGR